MSEKTGEIELSIGKYVSAVDTLLVSRLTLKYAGCIGSEAFSIGVVAGFAEPNLFYPRDSKEILINDYHFQVISVDPTKLVLKYLGKVG